MFIMSTDFVLLENMTRVFISWTKKSLFTRSAMMRKQGFEQSPFTEARTCTVQTWTKKHNAKQFYVRRVLDSILFAIGRIHLTFFERTFHRRIISEKTDLADALLVAALLRSREQNN